MTSRERVLSTVERRVPDRVPLDLGSGKHCKLNLILYKKVLDYFGMHEDNIRIEKIQQPVYSSDAFYEKLQCDVRAVYPDYVKKNAPDTKWEDDQYDYFRNAWGTEYRKPKDGGYFYDMSGYPLIGKEEEEDKLYVLPEVEYLDAKRADDVNRYHEEGFPVVLDATYGNGFLQTGPRVYGYEDWFMILAGEPERAEAFLDRLLEKKMEYWDKVTEVFGQSIDIVSELDDLGAQRGPLISEKMFRTLIKPYYKKLFPYIKKKTGAKLFMHCCGSIKQFIPDFIEVGVDILNPVQTSAENMEPHVLKSEFGKDICFWGGGIDTQQTLPFGTPQQIRDEVKRNIDVLGKDGGFVFAPIHNIQATVPLENFIAMWEAFIEYR